MELVWVWKSDEQLYVKYNAALHQKVNSQKWITSFLTLSGLTDELGKLMSLLFIVLTSYEVDVPNWTEDTKQRLLTLPVCVYTVHACL